MSATAAIIGIIVDAIPEAIGLISDLVKAGKDPITEIRRIRQVHPLLTDVDDDWDDAIRRKFGEDREIAEAMEDIYASLDDDDDDGGGW